MFVLPELGARFRVERDGLAAEAAVGLGIIIAFFRNKESVDVDDASLMKN